MDHKALLPFFDMNCGSRVQKAEVIWVVQSLNDAAEICRPQECGVSFHSDDLPWRDRCVAVHYPYPAQIELLPREEALASGLKNAPPPPKEAFGHIMNESRRQHINQALFKTEHARATSRSIDSAAQNEPLLFLARPEEMKH
ncbi:MAG TPA: hypothetical protein VJU82_00510 [Acidobacteriaceae bacterium]|nr:hypothetical protein [Acidobacteriaceae bacterium]